MQKQITALKVIGEPSRPVPGGVAFYDFACSPYSYDFVSFLANARDHGAEKIILVPGERSWSKLSKDQEQYRFTHLILPLARLYGEHVICKTREEAEQYEAACVWPLDYKVKRPKFGHVLAQSVLMRHPGPVKPSAAALEWAKGVVPEKCVTITVRRSLARAFRDSKLDEWLAFAARIKAEGYNVLLIPDTERPELDTDLPVCVEAAFDVDKRCALYDTAMLNMGINNGPMGLCWYSTHRPFMAFAFSNEGQRETSKAFFEQSGLPEGAQFHWLGKHQRLMWEPDTAENLYKGFKLWLAVQEGTDKWPLHVISKFQMECASNPAERIANMDYAHSLNLPRMPSPVTTLTEGRAAIVCYGPSLRKSWRELANMRPIFTVSGAHDFLIERGIVPDFHVECDPRIHKAKFLENPHKDVTYLIASCCNRMIFNQLTGMKVLLWHIFNGDYVMEWLKKNEPGGFAVTGGSTVGLRAIEIAGQMGFRAFDIFGMDCSFDDDRSQHAGAHGGKMQGIHPVRCGTRDFLTSGQMIQQAWDFRHLMSIAGSSFVIHGDGLLRAMVEEMVKESEQRKAA